MPAIYLESLHGSNLQSVHMRHGWFSILVTEGAMEEGWLDTGMLHWVYWKLCKIFHRKCRPGWIRPLIAKKQSIHSGSPVINSLSNDALCPAIISAQLSRIYRPPSSATFHVILRSSAVVTNTVECQSRMLVSRLPPNLLHTMNTYNTVTDES